MSECECFTCANKEDLKSCKAYLLGQFEAYRNCLEMLKSCGVTSGSLLEEGFSKMFAVIECNMDDSADMISSPEFKNIKFKGKLDKEFSDD